MKIELNTEILNEMELKSGKVSYRRAVERYVGDIVLCNNIADVDVDIFANIINEGYYDNEENYDDVFYQYFLCNLDDYEREILKNTNIIISYSDVLGCDVLMVNHFGTSYACWDYVMTDVEWQERGN